MPIGKSAGRQSRQETDSRADKETGEEASRRQRAMQLPTTVTNPLSAPPTQVMTGRSLPWRAGAVLQAVVLEASVPGRVDLQIGNQTISARTLFQLSEGQVLSLRVAHTGELVILQPEEAAGQAAVKAAATDSAQQALRQALPRQAALPPLLANLTLLVRSPERFPPQLVEAARAALKSLPDARTLGDPDTLTEHVERSGVWLEATLASLDASTPRSPAIAGDWKAALLRLASSLRAFTASSDAGSPARAARDGESQEAVSARTQSGAMPSPNPQSAGARAAPAELAALLAETLDTPAPAARAASNATAASSSESAGTNAQGPTSANATTASASQPDAVPLLRASAPHPQSRVPASLAQAAFAAGDASGPADHVLKQVEGALARVELGQLASLRSDDAHAQMWLLELPVRAPDGETDVLQLRIQQEAAGAPGEQPVWAVSLAFDLAELGPVRARIAVRGEQVSTLFYAEREATVARVRSELGDLEEALTERGLSIGSLGCRAGVPAPVPAAAQRDDDAPLLAVEA
jgi:flagellar motor switch/type III secretory pathway protein FliN